MHARDFRPAGVRSSPSPPGFPPDSLVRSGGSGFSVTCVNAAGSGTEALPPIYVNHMSWSCSAALQVCLRQCRSGAATS